MSRFYVGYLQKLLSSNDGILTGSGLRKAVQEHSRGVIWGTIPTLGWRTWEKHEIIRIAILAAEIWIRELQVGKQG